MEKYSDILCFAAHPDDIELACGGTVAKSVKEGLSVVIADFTRGESGTRGTPEQRLEEAKSAAKILGVRERINFGFPDGRLHSSEEAILKAVETIRLYKPKIVLMNQAYERHPDHEAVHKIVRKAMFISGLRKFKTYHDGQLQDVHRIRKMYSYLQSYEFTKKPDFYVDISDVQGIKMNAIRAFASQVYVPGKSEEGGPITRLSRPEFLEEIEARSIYFGTLVGVRHAEAFVSVEPIVISGLSALLKE